MLASMVPLPSLVRREIMVIAAEQQDLAIAVRCRQQRGMDGDYVAGRNGRLQDMMGFLQ